MDIIDQILEGEVCLTGDEGKEFVYYETMMELARRIGELNPYRHLDKTLWELIREIGS